MHRGFSSNSRYGYSCKLCCDSQHMCFENFSVRQQKFDGILYNRDCNRILQSGSPSCLSSLININISHRSLSWSSLNLSHVPLTTKAVGHEAFRFTGPTVWSSTAQNIRLLYMQSQNLSLFSPQLTTFPTLLHPLLWLELAWICAINKFCNNNSNDSWSHLKTVALNCHQDWVTVHSMWIKNRPRPWSLADVTFHERQRWEKKKKTEKHA